MLTNNKKRSFVKLIALTLAALMVFSVCLTGCTDEDARLAADAAKDAADKAQSTADAAQTAADGKTTTEAVAAQIAEALKPYLKADAALSEADVDKKVADLKATIEASLKNYQAKGDYAAKADLANYLKTSDALTKKAVEDMLKNYQAKGDYATTANVNSVKAELTAALKGYASKDDVTAAVADFATKAEVTAAIESFAAFAKSEDLTALSEALSEAMGAALTMEQVAEAITDALVGFATEAYVDDAIAAAKAEEREITTKEIADAIKAALDAYDLTVQDRIDALEEKLTKKIESYFGAFEPDQVVELLKDVDKAMDADEWAAATVMIIRVLDKAAKLFSTDAADKAASIMNRAYTQERKAEINDLLGNINGLNTNIVVFPTVVSTYTKDNATLESGRYLGEAFNTYLLGGSAPATQDIDVRLATKRILTDLTVFILRAASVAEIQEIETRIDNAAKVPSFESDMAVWMKEMYAIGTPNKTVLSDTYEANVKFPNTDGNKYHGNAVAKNGTKYATVAVATDSAKYNALTKKLETMVVEYLLESALFGTTAISANFGAWNQRLVALWKCVDTSGSSAVTTYHWETPGSYLNETHNGFSGSALADASVAKTGTKQTWTFEGYFAGIDESAIPSGADKTAKAYTDVKNANWNHTLAANSDTWGVLVDGFNDKSFLDPKIKVDHCTEYTALVGATHVANLLNAYDHADDLVAAANTYKALAQMISDATYANDTASDLFAGKPEEDPKPNVKHADDYTFHKDTDLVTNRDYFLWHIGHKYVKTHNSKADGTGDYVCTCSLYDDAWYVDNLKAYMVEQTEDEPFEMVPTSWKQPVWLTPVVDLKGNLIVAPWNYDAANPTVDAITKLQEKTIDVYFNYAFNINGLTSTPSKYDAIDRFELYEKLHRAAWEVLYAKYAGYANQVLNTMVNDFRVVAKAAANKTYASGEFVSKVKEAAKQLNLHNVPGDITNQWSEPTTDAQGAMNNDGFIHAYTDGAASNNQWYWTVGTKNGNLKKQVGPSYTIEGLAQYYANNGDAKYPIGVDPATGEVKFETVTSDVVAAIGAAQATLDTMLVASSVGPRKQIIADSTKYANGISDEEWAVLKGKRVQDAFDDVLGAAMDNLEEIMYRFMYTEINEAFINKAYAAVTQNAYNTVTGNHTYANGIADFFAHDDDNKVNDQATLSALTQMMQLYVSGYASSLASDYAAGVDYTNQGFQVEAKTANNATVYVYTPKANVVFDNIYMSVSAPTAEVYSDLKGNTITNAQQAQLGDEIEKSATDALAKAKTIYANSINTMANMAVKYRFHDYIQQAKDSAYFSYLAYVAVAGNYDQRLALDSAYNTAANALTITEYYAQRGAYEEAGVMKYLNYFVENVLAVSTAATSPYYALMGSEGSSYAAQLENIPMVKAAFKKVNNVTKAADLHYVIGGTEFSWTYDNKFNFLNDAYVADIVVDDDKDVVDTDAERWAGAVLFVIPQSPLNGLVINNGVSANNYYSTGSATISYDAVVNAGK